MISERELKYYRIMYAMQKLAYLTLILAIPGFWLTQAIAAWCIVLSIALGGFSEVMAAFTGLSRDKCHLLAQWRRVTKLPAKTFPITDTELMQIERWSEKMLIGLARKANEAIDRRDRLGSELEAAQQHEADTALNPREVFALRESVASKKKEYARAIKTTNRIWEKYLNAWDLFTKRQLEGVGVLTDYKNRHRDPNAFRRMVQEGVTIPGTKLMA